MIKSSKSASLMSTLQHLLDHVDLSANGLAKILNVPTPTVYRLTTGEVQDPRISTLTMLADYFGITIEQLLGRKNLDAHFYAKNAVKYSRPTSSIPLLTLHETYSYQKYLKEPTQWFRWKSYVDDEKNDNLFSVIIKNNLYEPLFSQDVIIVIDPTIHPENGDYVLINFKGDNISVFKRYLSEGRNKYLAALNIDGANIKFDSNETTIIGVVIESCRNFKN